jgi:hypothetical protein
VDHWSQCPATSSSQADFVIEGHVDPSSLRYDATSQLGEPKQREGFFGDHTSCYTLPEPHPLCHVTAITHRVFLNLGRNLNRCKKLSPFHNGDAMVVPDAEQMPVAADEVLGLPVDGTFQNGIIIGIGGDGIQCAGNCDDLGEGANLIRGFRRFGGVKAAFELKFLRELGEDGFAGDGQAFALARG